MSAPLDPASTGIVVGVPSETLAGEHRVAVTPAVVPQLLKAGLTVLIESGAGAAAGFDDESYRQKGATIVADRREIFAADVVLQVRTLGASGMEGRADLDLMRPGQVVIGLADPLSEPAAIEAAASSKVTAFALELLPRITRAQAMDVLSSQAMVGGYKAVLLAAAGMPKMFPLLTTAAGTIAPARVLVIGAGVAGLSAIATARRLGAVVEAYDVRPAAREHVESLGARFVELPLAPGDAEDASGYAKALGEQFYLRQRELLKGQVTAANAVITTAVIPGERPPVLIDADMVRGMRPGSVIVDLAAERGGNCELTRPDEVVVEHGVTILGPTNLPSTVAFDSSQMYAKNVSAFLLALIKEGALVLNDEDEIVTKTMVLRDGEVVNPRVQAALQKLAGVSAGPPSGERGVA